MLAPSTASSSTPASRIGDNGLVRPSPARPDVEWIALFTQNALTERQVSASTLEAYTLDLAMLSRWAAGQDLGLLTLTTTDLTRYVVERAAQGTQLSTLARHLSSYRRFFSFLVGHGAIRSNPAAAVLVPQALRQASGLVRDDILRVLLQPPRAQFNSTGAAYRAQRDHAIICVLYGTGLGISDVRLLRWEQIDEDWQIVRVPLRNGSLRSVVLDGPVLNALRALHEVVVTHTFVQAHSAYCFPTASGLPMTRQALCHMVRKWASECGEDQVVTPSALRQTGLAHQLTRRPSRRVPAVASGSPAHVR